MTALISWLSTLTLRLYRNVKTPVVTDTAAAYTEANFGGYAAIPLTAWAAAILDAAGNAESDVATLTFTCSSTSPGTSIIGYYLTDPGGVAIFAEQDPAGAFVMDVVGKTYKVTPSGFLGALTGTF
jgi:hypothetical protein